MQNKNRIKSLHDIGSKMFFWVLIFLCLFFLHPSFIHATTLESIASNTEGENNLSALDAATATPTPDSPFESFEGHVHELNINTPIPNAPVDKRGNPVNNAIVEVRSKVDNELIGFTSTNYQGYFRFGLDSRKAPFLLRIKKAGFKTITATFSFDDKKPLYGGFIANVGNPTDEEDQYESIKQKTDVTMYPLPTPDYNRVDTVLLSNAKLDENSLGVYIVILLTWMYSCSFGIAVIFLISAGYAYITSTGNPSAMNRARKKVITTLTALGLIVSAWTITSFVVGFPLWAWGL